MYITAIAAAASITVEAVLSCSHVRVIKKNESNGGNGSWGDSLLDQEMIKLAS